MFSRCVLILGLASPAWAVPVFAVGPDMSVYWPNQDGLSWTYEQSYETFFPTPGSSEQVVRVYFAGTTVAPNGIDAQVLREDLISGSFAITEAAPEVTDPLLRNLWRARPDLRPAIARLATATSAAPCPTKPPPGIPALLLGGEFAFRKTADEIAAWRCNQADTRAWLWLVSDLTFGNTFTLQLVPDLADDVFLQGTIVGLEDVTVPGGTFKQCLRVDYVVDYGTSACTDPYGYPMGTYRAETRGHVHYAAGTGPVRSLEEFIPYVEAAGACVPKEDIGRVSSRLTRMMGFSTVKVMPATWGQVKAIYR